MGKRLCLLTETYHPVTGGGETQARALARGLVSRGWSVLILTRRSHRGLARQEEVEGVRVLRLGPTGPSRRKKWGLLVTALWALLRHRRDYDAVVVSGFRILGIPTVLAAVLTGKPCLLKSDSVGEMSGEYFRAGLEGIGLQPTSFPFSLFLVARNAILKRAEVFVAISSAVERELREAGVPPERIRRIPNSVDVDEYRPVGPDTAETLRQKLGLPENRLLAIYTGRLVSYKGLPLLLDVWSARPDLRASGTLVLVGAGGLDMHNCEAALKGAVGGSELEHSVHFTGEVPDVREYLQASDIFVLPSENEAFGISLIEAMAVGLPVISSDAGGLADIVEDGVDGLSFPAGDGERLRGALERLFADEELRRTLGAAARRSAVDRYSTESVVERYEELVTGVSA